MHQGAMIGVGKIAQTGHLPAFGDPRISDRARIVAGVDPDPVSRRLAQEKFPHLRLYAGPEEMFANEKIDFVDICSPPVFHGQLIELADRWGKHILCEKPLAASLDVSEAAFKLLCRRRPPVVFMPCHQYRYSSVWRQMKDFLSSIPPNEGTLLQFNVFRSGADPGLQPGEGIWRIDDTVSGGGILSDTGVHYLYLSLWMAGLPRAVTARTHRLALREGNVEDTTVVILEYGNRLVEITLTWGADHRSNSACVVSSSGSWFYDGESLVRTKGSTREAVPVPDASNKFHYIELYVALLNDFLERLEGRENSGPDLDEAFSSMRLLDACYASARSGSRVLLEPAP